jgi:hypothetical protein
MSLSDIAKYSPIALSVLCGAAAVVLRNKISTVNVVMLIVAALMFVVNIASKYVDISYSQEISIGSYIFAIFLLGVVSKDTYGYEYAGILVLLMLSFAYLLYEGYNYLASGSSSSPASQIIKPVPDVSKQKVSLPVSLSTCEQVPADVSLAGLRKKKSSEVTSTQQVIAPVVSVVSVAPVAAPVVSVAPVAPVASIPGSTVAASVSPTNQQVITPVVSVAPVVQQSVAPVVAPVAQQSVAPAVVPNVAPTVTSTAPVVSPSVSQPSVIQSSVSLVTSPSDLKNVIQPPTPIKPKSRPQPPLVSLKNVKDYKPERINFSSPNI